MRIWGILDYNAIYPYCGGGKNRIDVSRSHRFARKPWEPNGEGGCREWRGSGDLVVLGDLRCRLGLVSPLLVTLFLFRRLLW
jgi:hypothetical protein